MKKKLSILGVGYVGLPLAIEFSKFYNVVGYDQNKYKIDNLQLGIDSNQQYKRDKIINKLELVSRDEFEVLKKVVQKQETIIQKLLRNKKIKKVKKS